MVKKLTQGEKRLKEELFGLINRAGLNNKSIVIVLANLLNAFKKIRINNILKK